MSWEVTDDKAIGDLDGRSRLHIGHRSSDVFRHPGGEAVVSYYFSERYLTRVVRYSKVP